jgi:hypothetical protein
VGDFHRQIGGATALLVLFALIPAGSVPHRSVLGKLRAIDYVIESRLRQQTYRGSLVKFKAAPRGI